MGNDRPQSQAKRGHAAGPIELLADQKGRTILPILTALAMSRIPAPLQIAKATIDPSTPNDPPVNQSAPASFACSRPLVSPAETAAEKIPPSVKFQAT